MIKATGLECLTGAVIIARVVFVLIIWLGLFVAMFLGYFTVPIIVVGGITLIYALSDLGFFFIIKKNRPTPNGENHTITSIRNYGNSNKTAHPQADELHARHRGNQITAGGDCPPLFNYSSLAGSRHAGYCVGSSNQENDDSLTIHSNPASGESIPGQLSGNPIYSRSDYSGTCEPFLDPGSNSSAQAGHIDEEKLKRAVPNREKVTRCCRNLPPPEVGK